ncbi:MAG: PAS-domain containing protein [Alphaproteobacteria bacterium]|nr:PAS-domain containing protein [Alphaproteobacteria bacterium]
MPGKEKKPSHLRSIDAIPEEKISPESLDALQSKAGFSILESVHPVYLADLDGNLLYANDAFKNLGGAEDGPVAETPPFPIQEIINAIGKSEQVVHRNFLLRRGSKTEQFHSRHFPVHDAEGNFSAVAGMLQAVSYSAGLRSELTKERERFEDIARLVSDWLWETDENFNNTYASSRVFDLIGVLPREVEGQNLFTFGHFRALGEAIDRPGPDMRSPFREEVYEVDLPEGGKRTFRLSGLPVFDDETGEFRGYRGTAEDVTNETLAWSRAVESRIQLVEAIESIQDAFAIFDTTEHLVLSNTRFREDFLEGTALVDSQATLENILRVNVEAERMIVPGKDPAWLQDQLSHLRETAGFIELELQDGRWVKFTLQPITNGGSLCFLSDITDLKEREAALQEAKEAADAASQMKSDFLANMSHELRTPLNAVIGFSEVMYRELMGPLGNDGYHNYTKDILESSKHLLNIINSILDVSKAEAGRLDVEEQLIDIQGVTETAVRLVHQKAEQGGIKLVSRVVPGLPRFRADGLKIKQILLNLLSNAIKFTPKDGRIDVEVSRDADGGLVIAIKDTGIGIAPEDVPKALAPFGQVDNSLSRRYAGTGLGLPLTKKLVELHGGTLTLSSRLGEGTEVSVHFPAKRFELPDLSPPAANAL